MFKSIILALTSFLIVCSSNAQILDGKNPQVEYSVDQMARSLPAGTILVIGELHGKSKIQNSKWIF